MVSDMEGNRRRTAAGRVLVHRRGRRAGHVFEGEPGNLGDPDVSVPKLRVGHPGEQAQATRVRAATVWCRRQRAHGNGTATRGNECVWEGHQEVGVSHCTDEVGEPTQRDPVEGRRGRLMDSEEGTMTETPNSTDISTKLQRIAELAKKAPELAFNTLAHHLTIELLTEAHVRTRKDAAVGIDGQTADEYAKNLKGNLQSLLDRVKSGTYRAPPVRRVFIPKDDGSKTRPIGIPTFEDKVLQRAVVMILEPIYEQDF